MYQQQPLSTDLSGARCDAKDQIDLRQLVAITNGVRRGAKCLVRSKKARPVQHRKQRSPFLKIDVD